MNNYTKQFINGEWINGSSDKTIKNTNPFNGDLINEFNSADEGDLDRAYLAAEPAQKEWAATNLWYIQNLCSEASHSSCTYKS